MTKRVWQPSESTVEIAPNRLTVAHDQPGLMNHAHWHSHVEVNFVIRGTFRYRMRAYTAELEKGTLALFWGGMPHQVIDTSVDSEFIAVHLPLVHFFRLHLPNSLVHRVMHGATLLTGPGGKGDFFNFRRWSEYLQSGDVARTNHAVEELLLRIERIPREPFRLIDPLGDRRANSDDDEPPSFAKMRRICDFITDNFRQGIKSADIANFADLHPKYAMSLFRRSTGMTLNEYVNLLRLSYAQAMLINDEANVLHVAMESGFGSLSAFNKCFRKISGKSPTDFRRDCRPRHRFHQLTTLADGGHV